MMSVLVVSIPVNMSIVSAPVNMRIWVVSAPVNMSVWVVSMPVNMSVWVVSAPVNMSVWLVFVFSAKAEQAEPDMGRQHDGEETSGRHCLQCGLHPPTGLSARSL